MNPGQTTSITAENVLGIVHAEYLEAKADNDRKAVARILPIMARMAIYLHKARHLNNHYMTSMEALQSLDHEAQQVMSENMQRIAIEAGWERPPISQPNVVSPGKKRNPPSQNVFLQEALQDKRCKNAGSPQAFQPFPKARMHEGSAPAGVLP